MASLPLKLAIFFFIPKLPAIDQILPYYIDTRCYGSKRIQEGEGEPNAHYRILLTQRLTGTDTRTEMSTYALPMANWRRHTSSGTKSSRSIVTPDTSAWSMLRTVSPISIVRLKHHI